MLLPSTLPSKRVASSPSCLIQRDSVNCRFHNLAFFTSLSLGKPPKFITIVVELHEGKTFSRFNEKGKNNFMKIRRLSHELVFSLLISANIFTKRNSRVFIAHLESIITPTHKLIVFPFRFSFAIFAIFLFLPLAARNQVFKWW